MAVFRCKMCGGTIEFEPGTTVGICDFCGTKQTLPRIDDEKRANLYDRADHYRRNGDFEKAMGIYEQILDDDNTDQEAHWSLVLCRHGIEYVESPETHRRVPTVNRAQFTSIFMDEDYKAAIKYADDYQRSIYEEEAKEIDRIQRGILEISEKEEPYDVFICYKEKDALGKRTRDSVLANDLYHELTEEGFRVFFSRITLEDKLGTAYEPYIFAALNSAKVMVVLGTKPEYFNAVWVKNEWSRFLSLIKKGEKKTLIPAYRDMDPYDLPDAFSHLQAQDMSKLGFMQDLVRGIRKIAAPAVSTEPAVIKESSPNVTSLLKRAFLFLEDENFDEANEYCERVLDQDPENAEAYLGKLMADYHVPFKEDLRNLQCSFETNNNYLKILRFGNQKLVLELKEYLDYIENTRIRQAMESDYARAIKAINIVGTLDGYKRALKIFTRLEGYKDSAEQAKICKEKIEQIVAEQEAYRIREEQAKKKKKRIKMIIVLSCCLIAIVSLSLSNIIMPKIIRHKALKQYGDALSNAEFGDIIEFGHYEQDNDTDNGLEPIEWIVMQKGSSSLLLLSAYALDDIQYSDGTNTTWQVCNARKWLNDQFLNEAFTVEEISLIETVPVSTKLSQESYTSQYATCYDKIFLPDADFLDLYLGSASNKQCVATPYAIAKGAKCEEKFCRWCLRTHGMNPTEISVVYESGYIHSDGYSESKWNYAIRPIMYLSF